MKEVIYICGKVSGENINACQTKFSHAEDYLKTQGYEPVNPVKRVPQGTKWDEAMNICIHELTDCDGIFLLPDWTNSKGAKQEVQIALARGMKIINGFPSKN